MSSPRHSTTISETLRGISILDHYRNLSLTLEPFYQSFIAEVIMMRLFSLIENCFRLTALKIACEAAYGNGRIPSIHLKCRSMIDADDQFKNFNRRRPAKLKWTNVSFIKKNIKEIIPYIESYVICLDNFSLTIEEMRKVRNHIAHRTASTYSDFKTVIYSTYGANLKIQVGPFLTSAKRLTVPKIDTYLTITKIIANDLTKG